MERVDEEVSLGTGSVFYDFNITFFLDKCYIFIENMCIILHVRKPSLRDEIGAGYMTCMFIL